MDPVLSDKRITAFGLLLEATNATRCALESQHSKWGGMPQNYELLMRLARSEGQRLRMSDLALQCGLSPSGVSRTVDRLAHEGLVTRKACAADGRTVYAEITAKGDKLIVAALKEHVTDIQKHFIDVLSPTQLKQLEDICRTLRDHHRPEYTAGADD